MQVTLELCLLSRFYFSVELRQLISFYFCTELNDLHIDWASTYISLNRHIAELRYGPISYWDTSKVTCMKQLFFKRTFFNDDISLWDVSNVTDMSEMFGFATSFNQPLER